MSVAFFTVITHDYFKYAETLRDSLSRNKNVDFDFYCLVFEGSAGTDYHDLKNHEVDRTKNIKINFSDVLREQYIGEDVRINNIDEINHDLIIYQMRDLKCVYADQYQNQAYKQIVKKYTDLDVIRWSSKSIFGLDLLEMYEKVIYLDSDLYFHDNYDFLLDELNANRFILTPHNREETKKRYDGHYPILLWRDGFFNAGFFGSNQDGKIILMWWIKMLLFRCDNDNMFFHDDQKYLDYVPIKFENVKIIRHIGCNVSEWNYSQHPRITEKEKVYLSYANGDKVPVIFCHYTKWFIELIKTKDQKFKQYLKQYLENLEKYS